MPPSIWPTWPSNTPPPSPALPPPHELQPPQELLPQELQHSAAGWQHCCCGRLHGLHEPNKLQGEMHDGRPHDERPKGLPHGLPHGLPQGLVQPVAPAAMNVTIERNSNLRMIHISGREAFSHF